MLLVSHLMRLQDQLRQIEKKRSTSFPIIRPKSKAWKKILLTTPTRWKPVVKHILMGGTVMANNTTILKFREGVMNDVNSLLKRMTRSL